MTKLKEKQEPKDTNTGVANDEVVREPFRFGIYGNVHLLHSEEHSGLKASPIKGFSYAKNMRDCILTEGEFYAACRSQPILFTKDQSGVFTAVVLLGLKEERNLFVDHEGSWIAAEYIPAYIRRYPFVFVQQKDDSLVLAADLDSDAFSGDEGALLFNEDGSTTEYTKGVLSFMENFQAQSDRTRIFIEALDEMGLLEEASANMTVDGEQFTFGGFMRVNEKNLNGLDDASLLKLTSSGYYKLIVAHMISLNNFNKLMEI